MKLVQAWDLKKEEARYMQLENRAGGGGGRRCAYRSIVGVGLVPTILEKGIMMKKVQFSSVVLPEFSPQK